MLWRAAAALTKHAIPMPVCGCGYGQCSCREFYLGIRPHPYAALSAAGARGQVGHLDVGGNKLVRENKILVHEVGE